ncbi:S8 family peptidase [Baekduia sp. Peel2402]|uniref:S8 family peptidase n=1 Tax=Baekduia sp. Peel2402 TaxID=3458296 RepID=UPI00403EF44A
MRPSAVALLLTASLVAVAPASAATVAPGAAPDAAPELSSPTVLVKTSSEEVAEAVARRHDLTVSRGFPWIGWYELATAPGTTDAGAARTALAQDPDVKGTDAMTSDEDVVLAYQPKDPIWNGGTLATGEQLPWHLSKTNLPAAWDRTTGAGAQIGIIDSEFDTQHPDLQAKVRNPYNTASGTPNYHTGNVRAADSDSPNVLHGTHVAGIAAASTDNGLGTSGAGFDATFVPVRISTSFTPGGGNPVDAQFVGDLTEALGYMATQSVGVVNMSLGTTRNHPPLEAAIAQLRAKGVTIVASAGNFQESNPNAPIYPASYNGVIAVANTQNNDTVAPSSSNGNWVDIAAPGTNILSTWDTRNSQGSFPNNDVGYNVISGTSMASPLVTGIVALMKAVRPDLSPDEVETILKGTARDLGSPGADPQFGAGLINAAAAVNAAASYVRPAPPAPAPVPVPVPAAPPADTLAPKVSIKGLVTVAGRSVTVRFACAEACKGTARLRSTKRKLLASKSFTGKAGKSVTVRLKTKKKLKARSTVIVEIAARDAAGNLATKAERRKLRK